MKNRACRVAIAAAAAWWCLCGGAAEAAVDERLENSELRVDLRIAATVNHWSLTVHARTGDRWVKTVNIGVNGVFEDKALQGEYRRRLGTYYPLQKAMPKNVRRTSSASADTLAFRLAIEDLWLDLVLRLPHNRPILAVDVSGVSRPELIPQTGVRFAEPVFFLVSDADDEPMRRREWQARDYRERSLRFVCKRYMVPWAPEQTVVPMVLRLPGSDPLQAFWGRGGLTTLLVEPPYGLAFDTARYPRTAHSVQHRAIGFYGLVEPLRPLKHTANEESEK